MLWKSKVKLDVINFTENHILAKVVKEDGFTWFLTGFMGGLKQVKRRSIGHYCLIFLRLWMGLGVV